MCTAIVPQLRLSSAPSFLALAVLVFCAVLPFDALLPASLRFDDPVFAGFLATIRSSSIRGYKKKSATPLAWSAMPG
jgi:hypothetical protein